MAQRMFGTASRAVSDLIHSCSSPLRICLKQIAWHSRFPSQTWPAPCCDQCSQAPEDARSARGQPGLPVAYRRDGRRPTTRIFNLMPSSRDETLRQSLGRAVHYFGGVVSRVPVATELQHPQTHAWEAVKTQEHCPARLPRSRMDANMHHCVGQTRSKLSHAGDTVPRLSLFIVPAGSPPCSAHG